MSTRAVARVSLECKGIRECKFVVVALPMCASDFCNLARCDNLEDAQPSAP